MLLAIDIGNTNVKIALFKGNRILYGCRLATDKRSTTGQCQNRLRALFAKQKFRKDNIDEIIICSVVPPLTSVFKRALFSLLKKRPKILGEDIVAPIKNLYRRPREVGQDRLANAVAAVSKYGAPIIVVDFGTALTFDVVSQKGNYLGGVIVPGMEVSLKVLTESAALLPRISLSKPRALLGRQTTSSMKSGIVYGYSFLVEGILHQLKKKFKKRPPVIATGGTALLMAPYCKSIDRIEQNLTLRGLRMMYQRSKQSKKSKKK